ncbi:hypothetical protein R1flu_001706 [Riccia fluitans]|uniref:Uncharacterized protein n=1 Tax=Riccia fluitans TaxID=41844 RepID=A0ABD1Y417_9MARC
MQEITFRSRYRSAVLDRLEFRTGKRASGAHDCQTSCGIFDYLSLLGKLREYLRKRYRIACFRPFPVRLDPGAGDRDKSNEKCRFESVLKWKIAGRRSGSSLCGSLFQFLTRECLVERMLERCPLKRKLAVRCPPGGAVTLPWCHVCIPSIFLNT